MKAIGSIRYGSSVQGKLFMSAFFALSAIIGIAIIISSDLAEASRIGILWIIASCTFYMVLHEALHLLFMWMFSGGKTSISFVFPAVSVSCDRLFTRKQFIAIAAAPILLLGLILTLLLILLPKGYAFLISILITLSAAASGGDLLQIFQALRYPQDALFQDKGEALQLDVRGTVAASVGNADWKHVLYDAALVFRVGRGIKMDIGVGFRHVSSRTAGIGTYNGFYGTIGFGF